MKSVIYNNTAATIILPPVFNSFPLLGGQSKDFMYNNMPKADLDTLVALALIAPSPEVVQDSNYPNNSITFPGSVGLGILPGLQVTPALTYVINGQEPTGQAIGTTVYSMTDSTQRQLVSVLPDVWVSVGRDSWRNVSPMTSGRLAGASIPLGNRKMLCLGGVDPSFGPLPRGEVYDLNTGPMGTWSTPLGLFSAPVGYGTIWSAMLKDGRVLAAGGEAGEVISALYDPSKDGPGLATVLAAALTDVATSCTVVSTTGAPATGLLVIESELIAYTGTTSTTFTGLTRGFRGTVAAAHAVAAAVVYGADPWVMTGDLPYSAAPGLLPGGRAGVVLKDGRVLIAGGFDGVTLTNKSAVFNPKTLTWAASGNMVAASAACDMVTLKDGRVLLVGGVSVAEDNINAVKNCQIWTAGTWTAPAGAQMPGIPEDFIANSAIGNTGGGVDGTIGGAAPNKTFTSPAAVFSAADVGRTITFLSATTPANNGTFVISAVADATHLTFTNAAGVSEAYTGFWNVEDGGRFFLRIHLLNDGRVLAAGGYSDPIANGTTNGYARKSAVIFDLGSDTWTQVGDMTYAAGSQYSARQKTGSGGVVYAGGDQANGVPGTTETCVFDPIDDVFTSLRPMIGVEPFGPGFVVPQVFPFFSMCNPLSSGEFVIFGGIFDFTTFLNGSLLVQLYTPGLPSHALTVQKSNKSQAQMNAAWAAAKARIPARYNINP